MVPPKPCSLKLRCPPGPPRPPGSPRPPPLGRSHRREGSLIPLTFQSWLMRQGPWVGLVLVCVRLNEKIFVVSVLKAVIIALLIATLLIAKVHISSSQDAAVIQWRAAEAKRLQHRD